MNESMKIKAIAPWFGGKRTMAPDIVAELGKHAMYVEPFCGSMAVLFAKDESSHEIANDLHGHLINLARVIQSWKYKELIERLRCTLYSTDLFEESREYVLRGPQPDFVDMDGRDLEAAYHYFIVSWMGRNGVAGTERINYQKATRWTPGGGGGPRRFINTVETIPAWHQRLRNVDIQTRDAFDLLDRLEDSEQTVIYCDPPYMAGTRGTAKYEHEFGDAGGGMFSSHDDHARLSDALNRFKQARVVLSYYASDRVCELYPGWTVRDMTRQKNLHVQNRRGVGECEAPEILIINGPSYGKAAA